MPGGRDFLQTRDPVYGRRIALGSQGDGEAGEDTALASCWELSR